MGKRVPGMAVDAVVVLLLWQVTVSMLSTVSAFTGWGDETGGVPDVVLYGVVYGLPVPLALGYAAVARARGGTLGQRLASGRPLVASRPSRPSPDLDVAAGPAPRVAAALIDGLAMALLAVPVGAVLFMPLGMVMLQLVGVTHPDAGLEGVAIALLYFLAVLGVGMFLAYGAVGDGGAGTWGKRRMGLAVVTADGAPLGFRRASLRQLVKLIEVMTLVGIPLALALSAGSAPHDRVVGALVVHRR